MNKYKRLVSDTMIFGIGNFTTKFIYFFLMPIYTLSLTPEEYGLADLLNNLLYLLMPILTLCISDAVFRFVLDKNSNTFLVFLCGKRILTFTYIIAFFITLVIYLFFSIKYVWLFLLLFISESLKTFFAQYLRGLGCVRTFAINGILGAFFLLLSTYIFLHIYRLGVNGYLSSFIIANVISILFLIRKFHESLYISDKLSSPDLLKSMLRYCIPLIPNMLSWWITNISSRYIIVAYCGLGMAGLFAGASKIPTLINVGTSVFQQSWQYASVKEYQESNELMFYTRVFRYYSLFMIFLGNIVLVILPYISKFILKGEFYKAWTYTPLLIFSAILGGYSIFFGTFYAVVKANRNAMYSTMLGAFINLFFSFIFVPIWGVIGALIANVMSYLGIVMMRIYDSRKYVYVDINWGKMVLSLGLLLLQCIILTVGFVWGQYISIFVTLLLICIYMNELKDLWMNINVYIIKIKNKYV